MLKRYLNLAVGALTSFLFRDKIRRGSINGVKLYLQAVGAARMALLGLLGCAAFAAIAVAGIVLAVTGLVGLLPIEQTSMAIIILSIGVLLCIGTGIALAMIFSQRRWLEVSRSYELMDTALGPWPGVVPPNPFAASMEKGDLDKGTRPVRDDEERAVLSWPRDTQMPLPMVP